MRHNGLPGAKEPPGQTRAIVHVENTCHGGMRYTLGPTNYNPAAGGTAGLELVRNRDFEIRVWIGRQT